MNTRSPAGQPIQSNVSISQRPNESESFPQVSFKERNGSGVSRVYAHTRAHIRVDPCAHCSHWGNRHPQSQANVTLPAETQRPNGSTADCSHWDARSQTMRSLCGAREVAYWPHESSPTATKDGP